MRRLDRGRGRSAFDAPPPRRAAQWSCVPSRCPVTIAGQSQPNIGDVTVGIGGSATNSAVTGKISSAIASLGKAWSCQNVTIGQAGVGKQVTNSFAKLLAIGVVYRIMLIVIPRLTVSIMATPKLRRW